MAKYRRLRERLIADGVLPADRLEVPRAARWDELALVHTPAYLAAIASGTLDPLAQRRIGFPWSPGMVERSRRSVGATIEAAHAALREGVAANLAGGTHHAFPDFGAGYCVFNDVAVAARVLLSKGRVRSAAVIDTDVHQGDGTAHIFRYDPAVFTCSLHAAHNFPFTKERSDLDIEFPDAARDGDYLPRLRDAVRIVLARRPGVLFYVAGADAYERDRLGRLKLTIEGLAERDAIVLDGAASAGVPVVVAMGGGYAADIETIVGIHANTILTAGRVWKEQRQLWP